MTQAAYTKDAAGPVRTVLRGARRGFVLAGIFSLFLNLLLLAVPVYTIQIFDRVLTSGESATLLFLTLIAAVSLATYGTLEALRTSTLGTVSGWIGRQMSRSVVAASVSRTLAGGGSGSQPLRDLSQLQNFLGGQGILPFFDAPWLPVFLAVIFLLHPMLGLVALGGAVALGFIAVANERVTRRALTEAGGHQMGAWRLADAIVRNAEVVRGMGLLGNLQKRYEAYSEGAARSSRRATDLGGALSGASKFVRLFIQISILGTGAALVLQGSLTAGGMIAASILVGRALAPVEQSIGAWRLFVGAQDAYRRLETLLVATEQTEKEIETVSTPAGVISVENVSFTPPGGDEPVLKRVSFELQPGEILGVVGPSAAGKSTLCRLLVGVWRPTIGHVRLDGNEVALWQRDDFGKHVGYLPQDVELFEGTVAQNVARMGEPNADAVIAAGRLADAHEMIARLPQGYETDVGPDGAVLSGGQRQRVGLARAVYGETRFVVLDEPNAHLDQAGEEALLRAIAELKSRDVTVVMVVQRPSALRHVDKVMVLADGMVQRFGTPEEVLPSIRPHAVPAAAENPAPRPQEQPAAHTEREDGDSAGVVPYPIKSAEEGYSKEIRSLFQIRQRLRQHGEGAQKRKPASSPDRGPTEKPAASRATPPESRPVTPANVAPLFPGHRPVPPAFRKSNESQPTVVAARDKTAATTSERKAAAAADTAVARPSVPLTGGVAPDAAAVTSSSVLLHKAAGEPSASKRKSAALDLSSCIERQAGTN